MSELGFEGVNDLNSRWLLIRSNMGVGMMRSSSGDVARSFGVGYGSTQLELTLNPSIFRQHGLGSV